MAPLRGWTPRAVAKVPNVHRKTMTFTRRYATIGPLRHSLSRRHR
jgi:hypothetical protein